MIRIIKAEAPTMDDILRLRGKDIVPKDYSFSSSISTYRRLNGEVSIVLSSNDSMHCSSIHKIQVCYTAWWWPFWYIARLFYPFKEPYCHCEYFRVDTLSCDYVKWYDFASLEPVTNLCELEKAYYDRS